MILNAQNNVSPNDISAHNKLMMELSNSLSIIAGLIANQSFIYLDLPVYDNVGDLLIMQGTMQFFRRNKLIPKSMRSVYNFSPEVVGEKQVIVFQGGGNFGDLYPVLQKHRETVIKEHPENRVVILPQTIHFESSSTYWNCCNTLREHPDLHICVRDERSFRLAKEMTNHVYLLPDMAHALYPLDKSDCELGGDKAFRLMRSDIEKNSNVNQARNQDFDFTEGDWRFFLGRYSKNIRNHRKLQKRLKHFGLNRYTGTLTSELWIRYVDNLMKSILTDFSGYKKIETDRLHGHILACLMDKPNCVHDNSYGKNAGYVKKWTMQSPLVHVEH